MSVSRLNTAIDQGALVLPEGKVMVIRPPANYDISALPRDDVMISTGHYPDFARWSDAGFVTLAKPEPADVAIVVVPKSKSLARSLIGQAASWAKLVIVDGHKTQGIDSLFKDCRKVLGDLPSITKAHGRIFWFEGTGGFEGWIAGAPQMASNGYYTTAGVFSEGKIDKGSQLLAQALPEKLPSRIADIGAGWGYLSRAILERDGVETVDMIEAEALSLDCARLNVPDPRARSCWADATTFVSDAPYDAVIMNPPFHSGRESEPQLGQAFIAAASRLLAPNGKLWMVANRHLPYEQALRDAFRNVSELAGNGGFKVFHATRPNKPKGR